MAVVCLLPHGSVVIVQLMDVVVVGVSVVLVSHGILVHGGVGLRGGVVGRRDAVTGLTAVVAVPVVHSAVRVLVCFTRTQQEMGQNEGASVLHSA